MSALGAHSDPLVGETADWLQTVTLPDGSVPHVLPSASGYPRAPWMQPGNAGVLTYLTAAHLWQLGADHPWLDTATAWCWNQLEGPQDLVGYEAVFALHFLDAIPESARAARAVERFRSSLRPDGTIAIPAASTTSMSRRSTAA